MSNYRISTGIQERIKFRIKVTAKDLREMADSIERLESEVDKNPDRAVSEVVHKIVWGVANLGTDRLVSMLGDLREAKAAEIEADA
jgi:hypothetical protein